MTFTTTKPLGFGRCDLSGIAYFPAYLDMLVEVLEAFFADLGFAWPELMTEQRIATPTVQLDLSFSRPGFFGDRLEFEVRTIAVGRSSLDLQHRVSAAGGVLWQARQRLVATSMDTHKAIAWPETMRAALVERIQSD